MVKRYLIQPIFPFIVLILFGGMIVPADKPSKACRDTRKMLSEMKDRRIDSDKLVALFRMGDTCIADLIQLLDDPEQEISLHAQVVIRYLGNEDGMKALRGWYGKRNTYWVSGPIPLPISEWDYTIIDVNLIGKPPQTWGGRAESYIYALALDDSAKAKEVLNNIVKIAEGLDESTSVGRAIKHLQSRQPSKPLTGEKDLAKLVLNNAFFVAPTDRKYTSVRLLGFNSAKDKALTEVYINRGDLAEEWYHVVLSKCESGWEFFSIDPVAIS